MCKMRGRAFTLVELLVVIAIIAILAAFLFPVFVAARNAAYHLTTSRALKDDMTAMTLYMGDADDTFPLAMYVVPDGLMAWFGKGNMSGDGKFDTTKGVLSSYIRAKLGADHALSAKPYLGDDVGLGYNYGTIGSDFHLTRDYSAFPNCKNAARGSELGDTSQTVVLATSSYYYAPWLKGGDGLKYEFDFIDPPSAWYGNPNVDFRHFGKLVVDKNAKQVAPTGYALFAFADASVRHFKIGQVKEEWFWRRQGY